MCLLLLLLQRGTVVLEARTMALLMSLLLLLIARPGIVGLGAHGTALLKRLAF